MRILKFIGYCLPFLLGALAVSFIRVNKHLKQQEPAVIVDSKIQDLTPEYVENFIRDANFAISDAQFAKIKLQKNDKIYKFDELNDTKKNILKIMIYKQMLVKANSFAKDNNIKLENHDNLQKFQNNIESSIANSRNTIYKIYGTAIHPLDKDFLESL